MHQYGYPSPHSPYKTQQPVLYPTSPHSHHGHSGGYSHGTPLKRSTSIGHVYTSSPAYGYANLTPSHGTQYLSVPSGHHRSRSHSRPRHNSHHGHSTNVSYPVTYAAPAPVVYIVSLFFVLFQTGS